MGKTYGRKEIRGTPVAVNRALNRGHVIAYSMIFGLAFGGIGGGLMQIYNIPSPVHNIHAVTTEAVEETDVVTTYGALTNMIFRTTNVPIWKSDISENFKLLDIQLNEDLQQFTYYLCNEYGIEYSLVIALIERESGFKSDAIGDGVNYGLMQIHKINHSWLSEELGITDFLEPYQNIQAGVYMLCELFKKYENTNQVLMAYNCGETGAKRLWDRGVFETDYTKNILVNSLKFHDEITYK